MNYSLSYCGRVTPYIKWKLVQNTSTVSYMINTYTFYNPEQKIPTRNIDNWVHQSAIFCIKLPSSTAVLLVGNNMKLCQSTKCFGKFWLQITGHVVQASMLFKTAEYCILNRPVFAQSQILFHPELILWWPLPYADIHEVSIARSLGLLSYRVLYLVMLYGDIDLGQHWRM